MKVSVKQSKHEKVEVINPDRIVEKKEQTYFPGLDILGFILVILLIQGTLTNCYAPELPSVVQAIVNVLSNIAYPVFLIIPSYLLFKTIDSENPDYSAIVHWCVRLLIIYVIWSLIYLPVDLVNWFHNPSESIGTFILSYIQRFIFESAIPQLWLLPTLALACLFVGFLYKRGVAPGYILNTGIVLYIFGMIGDNDFYLSQFPDLVQRIVGGYFSICLTLRNAIFYGVLFVSLGLTFAKNVRRIPLWQSAAASAGFLVLAVIESNYYHETNFVISLAFAGAFLFMTAQSLPIPEELDMHRLRTFGKWLFMVFFYVIQAIMWMSSSGESSLGYIVMTLLVQAGSLALAVVVMSVSDTNAGKFLKRLIKI